MPDTLPAMPDPDNTSKVVLYTTNNGNVSVSVHYENETFWMTQKSLAELFGTTVANVNIHIKNILEEGELEEVATIKDSLIVQIEGSREVARKNRFYAEMMAEDNVLMSMSDWLKETDNFLKNNRRAILRGKGTVSHEQAVAKAGGIFEQFRIRQDHDYISNFDREMEKYITGETPPQKDGADIHDA